MIVVADTTPLNYLLLLDEIEILPRLYGGLLIPAAVHRELLNIHSPSVVRSWASVLPTWCEVRATFPSSVSVLNDLDEGEKEAITLALDVGATTLLIDDADGRRAALRLNLKIAGTIAILESAGQHGFLDFRATIARLTQTNFRIAPALLKVILERNS